MALRSTPDHVHCGAHHGGAYRDRGGLGAVLSQSNSQLPIRGPNKEGEDRKTGRRCQVVRLASSLLPAHIGPEATGAACRDKQQHLVCKFAGLWIGSRFSLHRPNLPRLLPDTPRSPPAGGLDSGVKSLLTTHDNPNPGRSTPGGAKKRHWLDWIAGLIMATLPHSTKSALCKEAGRCANARVTPELEPARTCKPPNYGGARTRWLM